MGGRMEFEIRFTRTGSGRGEGGEDRPMRILIMGDLSWRDRRDGGEPVGSLVERPTVLFS